MVLRLCPWRSHNLLPTFGTFHELENSLRMPINGLGNLMGSPGGPRKPTWRWNLKFFFHGINFYYKRGYFCEKRGWKSSKTKKFFFCTNTTCFYSVQWWYVLWLLLLLLLVHDNCVFSVTWTQLNSVSSCDQMQMF